MWALNSHPPHFGTPHPNTRLEVVPTSIIVHSCSPKSDLLNRAGFHASRRLADVSDPLGRHCWLHPESCYSPQNRERRQGDQPGLIGRGSQTCTAAGEQRVAASPSNSASQQGCCGMRGKAPALAAMQLAVAGLWGAAPQVQVVRGRRRWLLFGRRQELRVVEPAHSPWQSGLHRLGEVGDRMPRVSFPSVSIALPKLPPPPRLSSLPGGVAPLALLAAALTLAALRGLRSLLQRWRRARKAAAQATVDPGAASRMAAQRARFMAALEDEVVPQNGADGGAAGPLSFADILEDYEWVVNGNPLLLDGEGLPVAEVRANPYYWDPATRREWAKFVQGSKSTQVRDDQWWDIDAVAEERLPQLDNIDWFT